MEPVGTPVEDAVRPGIGTSNTRTPLPLDSSSTFNTPDIGKLSPSQAPGHPSLTAQSSSQVTVNDFGDSKELSEHRPPNNAAEDDRKFDGVLEKCDDSGSPSAIDHDPPSRDEIVSHAGGHFPDSLSQHQALREQDLRDRSANASHPDTIREPAVHEEALEEALRAALCNCPNSKDGFVPFDALNRLITKSRVLSELSTALPGVGREVIEEYSQAVLARKVIPPPGPTVIPTSSPTFTTRRKIFAILVLLDKVPAIVDFIREDLYDNILPLKIIDKHKQGRPFLYYRPVKDGDLRPLEFAIPWRAADREQFEQYQWRFLAPYFDVCNEKGRNKVHHYDLPDGTVLPFMEKDQYLRGGYSDVWRVIIHPAHHNHPQQNSPSFAMKRLRDGTDFKVFKAEASNLKRFNSQGFPHLIKLYLTFRLQGHYYLLFPWANGNLLQFMKTTFPDPRIPCRTRELAIWFMGECCGAAEALRMIHTFPTSEQPAVVSAPQAKHGYHGDLKPENILFFLDHEGREDLNGLKMAVLKIGDFGLMQWHNSSSVEKVQANAVSRTYRAPEWDIGKKVVSQSYDIWALGCVLLEFCAWYLGGWEEVDQFSLRRAGGDSGDSGWDDFIREDAFFDYAKLPTSGPDDPDICVRAKQAVYEEFASLLNLSHCTDFMTKMLIFIREHLLRINSRNRADCDYICTELKKIHQECIADASFCTERLNVGTIRVGTDLSETYALNPSAVQKDQIQRQNPLLNHTGPVNEGNVEPLNHDFESPGPSRSSREARQSISFPEKEYNIVGKFMESKHDKGENITLVVEQSGADLLSEDHVVSPDNQDQQPRDTTIENGNNRNSHLVASQPTSPCEAIAEDELEEGMQSQKQTGEIEAQVNQAPPNANCPNAASSLNVPHGAPSHHSGASVKSGKGSRGASSITATNRSQENGSLDPGPSPAPPGDSEGPQLKRSFRSFLKRLFCFSSEV